MEKKYPSDLTNKERKIIESLVSEPRSGGRPAELGTINPTFMHIMSKDL
jgi:hypothetical protein